MDSRPTRKSRKSTAPRASGAVEEGRLKCLVEELEGRDIVSSTCHRVLDTHEGTRQCAIGGELLHVADLPGFRDDKIPVSGMAISLT